MLSHTRAGTALSTGTSEIPTLDVDQFEMMNHIDLNIFSEHVPFSDIIPNCSHLLWETQIPQRNQSSHGLQGNEKLTTDVI